MAFSFDNFMTGLAGGLASNKGPIGGFGQGWMGAQNAIKAKEDSDMERAAVQKILSGDDTGWQEWGGVNPQAAMGAWNNQQRLNQIQNQKEFNTTNERKNAEYLISQGWKPEDAINTAFKVKEQKDPFDTMYQREEAKQYVDDLNAVRTAKANFPQLEANVNRLRELAPKATFTEAGKAMDYIAKQFGETTDGAKARAELESIVNNAVLPLLKQTFGAAFTAEEGIRLQKTLANPDATDEEKIAELDTFIKQKMADIETKERKLGMYNQNYGNYQPTKNVSEKPQQPTQDDIIAELRRRGEI